MLPDLSLLNAELLQLPARRDNYIYVLRDHELGITAVFDPTEAAPVRALLKERGWGLDMILITHHHPDHIGGNLELKEKTGCIIIGYDHDAARIPGIDRRMEEGETVTVGRFTGTLIFIPGHTTGHVAYHFPKLKLLFSGDTLFSLGCGRLFEGTPGQMLASLRRIAALPDDTFICCTHEYTEANGRFALAMEPENLALQERMEEVKRLRSQNLPTVPMLLGEEKKSNPFLRPSSPAIRRMLDMQGARDVEVFAELRRRKDHF